MKVCLLSWRFVHHGLVPPRQTEQNDLLQNKITKLKINYHNKRKQQVIKVELKLLSRFHFITLFIYLDYFFWSPVLLYHKIISMKVQENSSLLLFFFLFFFIKQ